MGSSQGRPDKGASSAAASSSTSEDQPSPRANLYDPHDNSSFMSGWLLLRPPGKRKARAMWCLVKDGMMHEFKRAESKKPRTSRPLEGSLAMPLEESSSGHKRGFQLILGGLYGHHQQEGIEYELVDGCDDDVEKWLNSISAASLLAAMSSNGAMPKYAVEALAVSEQKALRRERRSRAVVGKAAQSWDGCSVSSSSLSTASTISVASSSSRRSSSPAVPAPLKASHASAPSTPAMSVASPPVFPTAAPLSDSSPIDDSNPIPPLNSSPCPPSTSRHFRRRAPAAIRRAQCAVPDCHTQLAPIAACCATVLPPAVASEFDV